MPGGRSRSRRDFGLSGGLEEVREGMFERGVSWIGEEAVGGGLF